MKHHRPLRPLLFSKAGIITVIHRASLSLSKPVLFHCTLAALACQQVCAGVTEQWTCMLIPSLILPTFFFPSVTLSGNSSFLFCNHSSAPIPCLSPLIMEQSSCCPPSHQSAADKAGSCDTSVPH